MEIFPKRKIIRLKDYDYSQDGAYFITICTKNRHKILGEILERNVGDAVLCVPSVKLSNIGESVKSYLDNMTKELKYAVLSKYVIMPNHVHLLITLNNGTQRTASPTKSAIPRIVHGMKTVTTKQIGFSIWQRSYHDRIIRDEAEYQKVWEYIETNPQKWENDMYYV